MTSGLALIFGSALLILILGAVLATILMERRKNRHHRQPVYVIDDAVEYALENIDPKTLDQVRKDGVRRIIEWSTHYLQGLAVPSRRRTGLQVIAGGDENAIAYIRQELLKKGHDYSTDALAEVLALEAGYLGSIGALGRKVEEGDLL